MKQINTLIYLRIIWFICDFQYPNKNLQTNFEEEKNEEAKIRQSGLLINFFGGFIGSVIGTLNILMNIYH